MLVMTQSGLAFFPAPGELGADLYDHNRALGLLGILLEAARAYDEARRAAQTSTGLPPLIDPNEILRRIEEISDLLRDELKKPGPCSIKSTVIEQKRSIARRVVVAKRDLIDLTIRILDPNYDEQCVEATPPTPAPGPTPGTGTDIMDWLKRNWVLVAAGAVILLLLARRR